MATALDTKLGRLLLDEAILERASLEEAVQAQVVHGGALDTLLLELDLVTEERLSNALQRAWQTTSVALKERLLPSPDSIACLPKRMALTMVICPFKKDAEGLHVMCGAPVDRELLAEVSALVNTPLVPHVLPEIRVRAALALAYGVGLEERYSNLLQRLDGAAAIQQSTHGAGPHTEDTTPKDTLPGKESSQQAHIKAAKSWDLVEALAHLAAQDRREGIADVAVAFALKHVPFAAIFGLRDGQTVGWERGGPCEGALFDAKPLVVPSDSVVQAILDSPSPLLGKPPISPGNTSFFSWLGRRRPRTVLLIPIVVAKRTVGVLYCDGGIRTREFHSLSEIVSFGARIGSAFEALLRARHRESPELFVKKEQKPPPGMFKPASHDGTSPFAKGYRAPSTDQLEVTGLHPIPTPDNSGKVPAPATVEDVPAPPPELGVAFNTSTPLAMPGPDALGGNVESLGASQAESPAPSLPGPSEVDVVFHDDDEDDEEDVTFDGDLEDIATQATPPFALPKTTPDTLSNSDDNDDQREGRETDVTTETMLPPGIGFDHHDEDDQEAISQDATELAEAIATQEEATNAHLADDDERKPVLHEEDEEEWDEIVLDSSHLATLADADRSADAPPLVDGPFELEEDDDEVEGEPSAKAYGTGTGNGSDGVTEEVLLLDTLASEKGPAISDAPLKAPSNLVEEDDATSSIQDPDAGNDDTEVDAEPLAEAQTPVHAAQDLPEASAHDDAASQNAASQNAHHEDALLAAVASAAVASKAAEPPLDVVAGTNPQDELLFERDIHDVVADLDSPRAELVKLAREDILARGDAAVSALAQRFPGRLLNDPFTPGPLLTDPAQLGPLVETTIALGPAAIDVVTEHLQDAATAHRYCATFVFARVVDDRALMLLPRLLHDAEPKVREEAANALRPLMAHPNFMVVLRDLRDALKSDRVSARSRAIHYLGEFRDVGAIPTFLELLDEKNRQISVEVRKALEKITLQEQGEKSKPWRKWWETARKTSRIDWLIQGLSAKKREIRVQAAEELTGLAEDDFGYHPDDKKRDRDRAVAAFDAWWNDQRGQLGLGN